MRNIFIGRQAIFTRDLSVYAYELLYRGGEENVANISCGERASSEVAVNAFLELGLDKIVGSHPAFVNLTRNFLIGEHPVPFPADRLVLEVLEDIAVDEELVAGVSRLASQGYNIALDDCVYSDCIEGLLEFASIVKLDIQALGHDGVMEHMEKFRKFPVKMVAEKIETQEEYDFCMELGFDYFQGYFLCRPRVLSGSRIPDNKLAVMNLLSVLQDPDIPASELETLISHDVSLSFKLLRYLNSAFFGLPKKVESIRQALVYLGNRAIKTWVTLFALKGLEDKPHELMTTAILRAKMCELLATAAKRKDTESYFTVGLFSVLDAMMDMPMEKILKTLPLNDEIQGALTGHTGKLGEALRCVISYERGIWDDVTYSDLSNDQITDAYLEALAWSAQVNNGAA